MSIDTPRIRWVGQAGTRGMYEHRWFRITPSGPGFNVEVSYTWKRNGEREWSFQGYAHTLHSAQEMAQRALEEQLASEQEGEMDYDA